MQKIKALLFICLVWSVAIVSEAQILGNATYYSDRFHGRKTSDGSLYHRDSLTCAHRTYPFGTLLKIRNPKNGSEVVVKVTDRGPHRKNAVIDLSRAAAEELEIVRFGIAQVEVMPWDGTGFPFRRQDGLPDLQLADPETGVFYTMPEWHDKLKQSKTGRALVRNYPTNIKHPVFQQDTTPRWRVLREELTAHTNTDYVPNFDYVKRYPMQKTEE